MLASSILAGVIGWEEYTLRSARSAEIGDIITGLRKWTMSQDSITKIQLQTEFETRLERINAPEAIVPSLPPDLLDTFLGMKALSQWRDRNRPAALDWLSKQSNPPESRLSLLLANWIMDAPVAAESYSHGLPAGPWKNRVLHCLATDAIQHGFPQRAIALIAQMPANEISQNLLNFAVQEWAHRDEESLRQWIESRPAARQREALFNEMRRALVTHSEND